MAQLFSHYEKAIFSESILFLWGPCTHKIRLIATLRSYIGRLMCVTMNIKFVTSYRFVKKHASREWEFPSAAPSTVCMACNKALPQPSKIARASA